MQQRAFARRLTKVHASDVRRQVASSCIQSRTEISGTSNRTSVVCCSSAYDAVDPVDFEECVSQMKAGIYDVARSCRSVAFLDYPPDDIELKVISKNEEFCKKAVAELDFENLEQPVKDVLAAYSADYFVVQRKYEKYSTAEIYRHLSHERSASGRVVARQLFELDLDAPRYLRHSCSSTASAYAASESPVTTLRQSWTSCTSESCSANGEEVMIAGVTQRKAADEQDSENDSFRQKRRQTALFCSVPLSPLNEMVELRFVPPMPSEPPVSKLIVTVLSLKLEPEFEPIFGSMALYDAEKRKRVSENFYFDTNSEQMQALLHRHVPYQDASTKCKSAVFRIASSASDLFLVVRLEKVLQPGSIEDAVDPYVRDEKNKDKLTTHAVDICDRLGAYHMPLAWSAVDLSKIISGASSLDRYNVAAASPSFDGHWSDTESMISADASSQKTVSRSANSLGRNTTLRSSWRSVKEDPFELEKFKPLIVTVNNFFKQEEDRLTDEDIMKYLAEIRKPSSAIKRLKCIGGTMRLDVSSCADEIDCFITPDLNILGGESQPVGLRKASFKEVLEFPLRDTFAPNLHYRNLFYVYPKSANFSGRSGLARNIAVKVEMVRGQGDALPVVFGKSSCPELQGFAFTVVNYHDKSPQFYDEIKMLIPVDLNDRDHILFTFYHVSCKQKAQADSGDPSTVVGYSWLPLYSNGRLPHGEVGLPISLEPLPPSYFYLSPEVNLPNVKWLENHRPLFFVRVMPVTTVYTEDLHIDRFFEVCRSVKFACKPVAEPEVHSAVRNLTKARPEALVKFLYIILDKLFELMLFTTTATSNYPCTSQNCFEMIGQLVKIIAMLVDVTCDSHGRSSLLAAYIKYSRLCNRLAKTADDSAIVRKPTVPIATSLRRNSSEHDATGSQYSPTHQDLLDVIRGFEKATSFRTSCPLGDGSVARTVSMNRYLHEEIAVQWITSVGPSREMACTGSWFFLELMSKSLAEYLAVTKRLYLPRKLRLGETFLDDLTVLVNMLVSETVQRSSKDFRLAQQINCSLAFFITDLLSLIDRTFVFGLIRLYCKQIVTKCQSTPESAGLLSMKLDFLRIVCSHEHYVTLNLPFASGPLPIAVPHGGNATSNRAPSPSPSISSRSSTGSTALGSTTSAGSIGAAELTSEFRSHHFLSGLVLTNLACVLEANNSCLQAKAVQLLRNLLTCHDFDERLADQQIKVRIASLYFPVLGIVMDAVSQLYEPVSHMKSRGDQTAEGAQLLYSLSADMDPTVTMQVIATGVGLMSSGSAVQTTVTEDTGSAILSVGRPTLSLDTTRSLLLCFCWVIKNLDSQTFRRWLGDLSVIRLTHLLDALQICVSCFEYKGRRPLKTEVEHDLLAESQSACSSPAKGEVTAKEQNVVRRAPVGTYVDDSACSYVMEGNLSTEISLIVLDTLEYISRLALSSDCLASTGSGPVILSLVLRILLHMFACSQSVRVLLSLFASQRAFVAKYPEILFEEETEQCAELCLQLLRLCASRLAELRSQAAASLYLLLRQAFETGPNFARVKMQITVSLSSLVGSAADGCWFNEQNLRSSLSAVLLYAEKDLESANCVEETFVEQVKDLIFNLHMILSDTVKMKEFQHDFEMLTDLMYRIAKGYQTSPNLRLTWLHNLLQKHIERSNFSEAAMCCVHSAALAAEYMYMLEDVPYLPRGAVSFLKISENVLEESAASDDVVRPGDEIAFESKHFTEAGLCSFLEQAGQLFYQAQMYEAMHAVYKVLLPIFEERRDYRRISAIYSRLAEALGRLDDRNPSSDKRMFGTYFRVGFYGAMFGDLDGLEFIYREPAITKLSEISHRLESFYAERFGTSSVEIIKDSNNVDRSRLSPNKAHLQITYVEPYFDKWELRRRVTNFEKNFNVNRFVYATPFTLDGRAHGELQEQYKRKTVLTTAHSFPYVKTRIPVVNKEQHVLTPIEVAIEDIRKKTYELELATSQDPPDGKILQMVLQGCIGTTVNQGPLEIANVFLSNVDEEGEMLMQNRLRLCFKDFSKKCADALRENKRLISANQREYQKELERNYLRFTEQLAPILSSIASALPKRRSYVE
uniref:Dedicator of cytokinesis protein 7 n=1 Tax=Trichuris muris TaxID=70415 RepID=A0A5S6QDK1_TRIMR